MPGDFQVSRLRISHLAAGIHDRMQIIGGPVAFAERLTSLQPVQGLPITLPFGDDIPVDTAFWSRIAERSLTIPVSQVDAPKLRRAGVPLRYRGTLTMTAEVPRLEVHLHPFGVVAMTTVDLSWSAPVSFEQAWQPVRQLEDQQTIVTVGESTRTTTFRRAPVEAARGLVELLTNPGQGEAWELPSHRLASVISGVTETPSDVMPAANSPLHLALHHLSASDDVLAVPEPATAFVAQWNGAGYSWPINNLIYMLESGTATLSTEAVVAAPAGTPRTADRHRRLLLLLAYINALSGLVYAARTSASDLFPEWAKTAATRLGRLFGPGRVYEDWGLVPRALMLRTNVSEDVQHVLGAPLTANPDYTVSDYG
jgi:hypothetical protein